MGNKSSTSTTENPTSRVFKVEMVAIGGKFRGMLGATYNVAYQSTAYRLRGGKESPIRYGDEGKGEQDNIYMDVFFLDHKDSACFTRRVQQVHRVPDLIKRDYSPTFETRLRDFQINLSQLVLMSAEDFRVFTPAESIDYDQPSQDLGSFQELREPSRKKSRSSSASRSSGRICSSVSTSGRTTRDLAREMLFKWQSFEKNIPENIMYVCHLLGRKYTNVTLVGNPDNFIGAYGDFHNGFDGLQTPNGVPRFVLEFVRAEDIFEQAEDGVRQRVTVRVRFRTARLADIWFPIFKQSFKDGSTFDENTRTIVSFVHVRSAPEFQKMLNVKKTLTEMDWKVLS